MMAHTYTQKVVCTGVKSHLKKEFPSIDTSSYRVPLCIRCGGSDKKRGKRKKIMIDLDVCRFQNFRQFSAEGNNIVILFCDIERPSRAQLPPIWNRPSNQATLERLQQELGRFLLPVMKSELQQEAKPDLIRRHRHADLREHCDCCWTSLFSSGWMCRHCGWEFCDACLNLIFDNLKYQRCIGKPTSPHELQDFSPTSRFRPGEVQQLLSDLETASNVTPTAPFVVAPSIVAAMKRADIDREVITIRAKELTNELFEYLWSRDDPYPILVVFDPGERIFQYPWDADFFARVFSDTECEVEDCVTGLRIPSTVGDFFRRFGKDDAAVLKLKDWPPSVLFQTTPRFCELHVDLMSATPVSDFTRSDGRFNVASYTPKGDAKSDLGPKMYSALKDKKNVGSTRIHKDVTDAWNVLTHANPRDGVAEWALFSRKDSGPLSEWMQKRLCCDGNPIHHQQTYLTRRDLVDLWEDTKIRPYIIRQSVNQFVLIPAGCAHQVSNQADCIKVACDMVLPWGLNECLKLAGEFREENLVDDPWMMDVVQTKLTALHAYTNIGCQLASISTMEVDQLSDKGDSGSTSSIPLFFEDPKFPSPTKQSPPPDDFVSDIDYGQQGGVSLLDRREKNRRNRELKKANRQAKRLQKTRELFNCPWCSMVGSCSISILKHVEQHHSYRRKLNKSQIKALKRAHQKELHEKLQEISISAMGMGASFDHVWD